MSISPENICNLALGHLKSGKEIADLENDKSPEAAACRLFYDICRKKVIEDFKWPFATAQVALALVTANPFPTDADGNSEWAYAYRYPADALNIVRILSGTRNESRQDRVPYRILRDLSGKLICTDMENAVLEYTIDESSEDKYSAAFTLALSLYLAMYIAPRVTGGDPFKLGDRAGKLYQIELVSARDNALNEEQMEQDPESEMIRAR